MSERTVSLIDEIRARLGLPSIDELRARVGLDTCEQVRQNLEAVRSGVAFGDEGTRHLWQAMAIDSTAAKLSYMMNGTPQDRIGILRVFCSSLRHVIAEACKRAGGVPAPSSPEAQLVTFETRQLAGAEEEIAELERTIKLAAEAAYEASS